MTGWVRGGEMLDCLMPRGLTIPEYQTDKAEAGIHTWTFLCKPPGKLNGSDCLEKINETMNGFYIC